MIPDIHCTPKRQNRIPEWILTGAALVASLSVVMLSAGWGSALLFQCLFIVAAVTMVYVATRYLVVSYTYTVSQSGGVFTVTRTQGKRITCLCRLNLTSLCRVRPMRPDDAADRSGDRYSYCVSCRPETSYLLFFREGDRRATVRLEPTPEFADLLTRIAEENARRIRQETDGDAWDEPAD